MPEKKEDSQFGEWCQMTGWHGILDFYIAKHMAWKGVWGTIVLVGCFFAIVQGANMIVDFASDDEWVTTISYEIPKKGYLEWPNLTICGLDIPPIGQETKFNYTQSEIGGSTTVAPSTASPTGTTTENTYNDTLEPSSLCPRIITSCGTIDTRGVGYGIPYDQCCHGSAQYTKISQTVQNCFTLKPNATARTHSVARLYYLLDPSMSPYKGDSSETFADSGFEVDLYLGYSDAVDDFSSIFYMTPGTRNVISMISEAYRTKQRDRLMSFDNVDLPCSRSGSYSYLIEDTYTKDLCATDCRIQWQVEFCKCYVEWKDYALISVKGGTDKCSDEISNNSVQIDLLCTRIYELALLAAKGNPEELEGWRKYMRNTYNISSSLVDKGIEQAKCAAKCPEPCEYGRIEAKMSTALFAGPFSAEMLISSYSFFEDFQYTVEEIKKVTMLELYFELKQQRVIEKKPRISLDEFISNLGGCLGVWSGLSLLSIFQMLFFLIRGIFHYVSAPKTKKVKPVYPPVSEKMDLEYHVTYSH